MAYCPPVVVVKISTAGATMHQSAATPQRLEKARMVLLLSTPATAMVTSCRSEKSVVDRWLPLESRLAPLAAPVMAELAGLIKGRKPGPVGLVAIVGATW